MTDAASEPEGPDNLLPRVDTTRDHGPTLGIYEVDDNDVTLDRLLTALAIYESEWEHRDTMLWSNSFKYFTLALIVVLLPYLDRYFNVEIPLPFWLFSLVGLAMTFGVYVVSSSYGFRLTAAGASIQKIQQQLPSELQRTRHDELMPDKKPFWKSPRKRIMLHPIASYMPLAMVVFLTSVNAAVFLTKLLS